MKMIDWLKGTLNAITNWKTLVKDKEDLLSDYNNLKQEVDNLNLAYDECLSKKTALIDELKEQDDYIESLQPWNTAIDRYCRKAYKQIDNIAYTQKRKTPKGQDYNIFLQECVTPAAWEVINFFRRFNLDGDMKSIAKKIGDKVAKTITWTDDKNLSTSGDYYLMPSETIADKRGDCEDHAFLCMSAHAELAGAWGFKINGSQKYGHAFNVFVQEGELYVLDTVGNNSVIVPYAGSDYEIYFIITRSRTYQLKSGVQFGYLAGWT